MVAVVGGRRRLRDGGGRVVVMVVVAVCDGGWWVVIMPMHAHLCVHERLGSSDIVLTELSHGRRLQTLLNLACGIQRDGGAQEQSR